MVHGLIFKVSNLSGRNRPTCNLQPAITVTVCSRQISPAPGTYIACMNSTKYHRIILILVLPRTCLHRRFPVSVRMGPPSIMCWKAYNVGIQPNLILFSLTALDQKSYLEKSLEPKWTQMNPTSIRQQGFHTICATCFETGRNSQAKECIMQRVHTPPTIQ